MANEDLSRLRIDRTGGARPIGRKKPLRTVPALAAVAALGLLAALYLRTHATVEVQIGTVTTAYPSQSHTLLNATGYVVAQRKAAVASKGTGRVEWLGVTEGSRVKQGEIIARLENTDVGATMEQAAANVGVARANLQQGKAELIDAEAAHRRNEELLAKGFISQFAFDAATARFHKARAAVRGYEAAVDAAEASHRAAQVAVEQTLIRAPFDGIVLTKSANVGDVITPFSSALDAKGAVVTMADMDTLEVEADVSESSLPKVRLEQPCEIQLDAMPDMRFRGLVERVVPTVDRAKATVIVKIRFLDRDPGILPEMSAKVAFLEKEMAPDERTARTVIPPEAVVSRNGRQVAFVVKDDAAIETPVETGARIGDMVEVLRGPAAGDKVVLHPDGGLGHGDSVKVAAK
ncbi:efflux RND transporter periplasmic adaptor subunit [Nitrosovibrio sp. Nv17]|uniref:efflux RND transporter periplasmic adaptor subunit n=1 Tax=Nitrosovibrio sp. Nv17 TaxID=1855339 RepID=UPI000908C695|nr:efflux RND transporter periplasmic adaptor subunit [Nitrosovibrio sp. Nv17]SFW29598.1 RND family efflux transporter, MFP subunit [Nitrosovibrio sp. Nv17]